ncbi:TIGR01777 family oxidoreductase [Paucibacter sp. KCTC 42545]|uniref:TIGR01777 family oxidoreductase n=1 Tax=Paucibacter sp. KCTC 42545 TaxID=1768242 RepID=UPI000733B05F|nr:TIGR01777 family oxidoreductase [Paucibacter sp. KCTC 42545]ALT76161.1 epimerase [Paucibacter sp. KCTC 42545]
MRILMTGGTGLIGRALCSHWRSAGHEVIVWSRQPERVPALCSGARGIAHLHELADAGPLDAVVNLAGAPIADRPWTAARRQILWRSRVDLTQELVAYLAQLAHKPEVLISGSAVGWYGDRGERQLDESSPPGSADFGAQLCQAWEQAAQQAEPQGIRVVLLRTAPVLAASGGMLARLRLPFSLGLGGRLGSGQQWMPWIHLDDEIALIDFLLNHTECRGAFNACAPEPARNADFTQALAAVLKRPAVLPAPAWALRMALGEMSVLLLGGQRAVPQRALAQGFRFRYPALGPALAQLLKRSM